MNPVGKKARIYANLNKGGVSIQIAGKVINKDNPAKAVEMVDVQFVIVPSGLARAVREGQRNVHAFAEGTVNQVKDTAVTAAQLKKLRETYSRISYNPFKEGYFVCNGKKITKASSVLMVLSDRYNDKGRQLCELYLIKA